ncbi:unnamed protein product [Polarella glacialis]|uniref:Uncharacterized protein n=1 Tax=Polarella glacialis TaxID=89957 RepID=A0A813EPS6_POLGL|nr:unnamed protein product [Polarella glacialis]
MRLADTGTMDPDLLPPPPPEIFQMKPREPEALESVLEPHASPLPEPMMMSEPPPTSPREKKLLKLPEEQLPQRQHSGSSISNSQVQERNTSRNSSRSRKSVSFNDDANSVHEVQVKARDRGDVLWHLLPGGT